jgi:putative addiction module component (TIGR02574 family)
MDRSPRDLETEALNLPASSRARLAERLIASLDQDVDSDAEQAWLEEAERRLDELEAGRAQGVPADTVFVNARSALK